METKGSTLSKIVDFKGLKDELQSVEMIGKSTFLVWCNGHFSNILSIFPTSFGYNWAESTVERDKRESTCNILTCIPWALICYPFIWVVLFKVVIRWNHRVEKSTLPNLIDSINLLLGT